MSWLVNKLRSHRVGLITLQSVRETESMLGARQELAEVVVHAMEFCAGLSRYLLTNPIFTPSRLEAWMLELQDRRER